MTVTLQRTILALVAGLAMLDGVLLAVSHSRLDVPACLELGLLAAALMTGAQFYQRVRPDPRLAAMLSGTAFLCAFSPLASILNYLLLPHTGLRIDSALAAADRAMGFDWPQAMRWMARHPRLNIAALWIYSSMLPQVALLTVVLASVAPERVARFCLAVALSALICIAIWAFVPSFGAFSVYPLPDAPMTLALDSTYAEDLVRLLREGPGLISPRDAKGLIGFPSYHAVLALLVAWHLRDVRFLRGPAAIFNLAVIAATPIQGGHHLVDVLAALPVTVLALFLARMPAAKMTGMVNRPSTGAETLAAALVTRKV
ncbi:MAG TPA: phosphatase PAP2 family protein [Rhizomicrobium sp.]|nr:phosphatase PAP2 family protein [Rhizomicrobium sp.]